MSCAFSDGLIAQTAAFSPCGAFLAIVVGCRLTIRDASTLELLQLYALIDKSDKVEFSPDSSVIYCAFLSRAAVQCFSITDSEWKCRINEGVAGLVNVHWMPDSRGIITFSDFGVQLSLWSLTDNTSHVVQHPKQPLPSASGSAQQQLIAFSDDTKFMAVVHRVELHDFIGVYSTTPLGELTKFKCRSSDVISVHWTPNSSFLVTVDSPLTYNIVIYTPGGEVIATFEAYEHALGIRSVNFFRLSSSGSSKILTDKVLAPLFPGSSSNPDAIASSQIMAVGSYDSKIRLMSTRSWQVAFILPLTHPRDMESGTCPSYCSVSVELSSAADGTGTDDNSNLASDLALEGGVDMSTIFQLGQSKVGGGRTSALNTSTRIGNLHSGNSVYVNRKPQSIKSLPRVTPEARSIKFLPPQQGVSWQARSHDGLFIAAREASMPRCLWIFKTLDAQLQALVVQIDAIVSAAWRPTTLNDASSGAIAGTTTAVPLLAFCTGTPRVYFWTPAQPSIALYPSAGDESDRMGGENRVSWADVPPSTAASVASRFGSVSGNGSVASESVGGVVGRRRGAGGSILGAGGGGKNSEKEKNTGGTTEKQDSNNGVDFFVTQGTQLAVTSLSWSKDGKRLLLRGREGCVTCDVPPNMGVSVGADGVDNWETSSSIPLMGRV